ncbi:MAG: tetratricopeptide repeat protein [Acidobacteria bacterium]|nr:tetratricopeptide repeat protein [Acidobacteriota bacterium]
MGGMKLGYLNAVIFLICALSIGAFAQARSITVKTEPNTQVFVDGVLYGRTGEDGTLKIRKLSAENHTLKLRSDGFKEKSQRLSPAIKGEVSVSLARTTDKAELKFQEAARLAQIDREKAIAAYAAAIKLRPGFIDAYIEMARLQNDNADVIAAQKTIATVKRLRPGLAEASAVEARILKDGGYPDKAIAAFKRAITEGKGFQPEAYTGLGLLYKDRAETAGAEGEPDAEKANYDEAAKNLKVALKQLGSAPDAIILYQLLGLVYERTHQYPQAIALYKEFLDIFPDTPEATSVRSFIVQLEKQMAATPQAQ